MVTQPWPENLKVANATTSTQEERKNMNRPTGTGRPCACTAHRLGSYWRARCCASAGRGLLQAGCGEVAGNMLGYTLVQSCRRQIPGMEKNSSLPSYLEKWQIWQSWSMWLIVFHALSKEVEYPHLSCPWHLPKRSQRFCVFTLAQFLHRVIVNAVT